MCACAKIADSRLTPECELTRGCGGVGILWKESLDVSIVTGIENDRICAVTVEITNSPLLVICVYLPTSDCINEEYQAYLISLESIINSHPDHHVIIIGDFNAHTGAEGGPRSKDSQNKHGKSLLEFASRNELFISSLSSLSHGPCYTYFQGDTKTTTDYCIIDAVLATAITNSEVLDHHPLNSSDHLPLSLSLTISSTEARSVAPLPARPNWNKALKDHSISFYQSKVRDLLCPYLCKEYNDPAYLDQDVKHICDQLLHIAVSTLPICKRRKKKKFYVNNEELQASSKAAKEAWQKWCQAGRPRSGALFNERNIRRKETKRLADKCRARLDRLKWQKNPAPF